MIYTRFGSEVEILEEASSGWLKVKRKSDGAIREWCISELKATGGLTEIYNQIEKTKQGAFYGKDS